MIYLIKSNDKLKIGYTSNLEVRLKQYKTHNLDIELLNKKEGSINDEKTLHSICSEYKIKNEWFKYNQFIIDAFNKYNPLNESLSYKNDYINIYLDEFVDIMLKIENGTQARLLALLWKESEINLKDSSKGNQIYTIKANKDKWAKELLVKLQTINNTLSALLEKNLLIKKDRSICMLNPKLFFKGFVNDRDKVIQTIITYSIDDKETKTKPKQTTK